MHEKVESSAAQNRLSILRGGARFAIVLMALATLCLPAVAQESTAQDWYQKGQDLARNGSLLDAVKAYDNAIDLSPGNLDARLNKAVALHQAGKINESVAAQNEAVKAAISYLGDLNQSVQVFNKAIEPVTSSSPVVLAEAWDHRGFLLADLAGPLGNNMSMYEEAIKCFDRAIELDPQRKVALINKGAVLGTRLNRDDEALLAYEKAIELGGANAKDNESLSNAWSGKGTVLAKLGRFNESIDAFDKAIELSPQTAAFVWLSKGDAFNESGRYEEAVKAYDKVVELNPDSMKALSAHAYGSKGDALSAWGKYDEAVKAYDNAIEQYPLEPMGAQTWYKKGLALEVLGRQAEAEAAYSKARELGYEAPFASSLVLTNVISVGDDEFIEVSNSENETQTFKGLNLTIDDKGSIALPDFTLEPGERIRFHLGAGESNETDIFLDSDLALDDLAGNLTLKNASGTLDKFAAYWTPEETARDWFEKGEELSMNGSTEEAMAAYEWAVELDQEMAEAWIGKGYAKSRLAFVDKDPAGYNESLLSFERAIELNRSQSQAWNGKATLLSMMGRYEEAVEAYGASLEIDPLQPWVLVGKANALWKLGRHDESIAASDEAIDAAFETVEKAYVWFERAHLFAEDGDYNGTVEALNRATELAPDDKNFWINGGVLLSAHLGRYEEALTYIDRALEIDPEYADAWISKAQILGPSLGRYDESLEACEKALEIDPEDPDAWRLKGLILMNLGRDEEALAALEEAIDLDPQNGYAWFLKGSLLQRLGRESEAEAASFVSG